jgi:hypothetical protein
MDAAAQSSDKQLLQMIRLACRMRSLLSRIAGDAKIASVYRRQSAECLTQLDKASDWIFTGLGGAPPVRGSIALGASRPRGGGVRCEAQAGRRRLTAIENTAIFPFAVKNRINRKRLRARYWSPSTSDTCPLTGESQ